MDVDGELGGSTATDAEEIGDPESVVFVSLAFADAGAAVGVDLEGVEDRYGVSCLGELVVESQPVVSGGFEAGCDGFFERGEVLEEVGYTLPGVGEGERWLCYLTLLVQEDACMGSFSHIDAQEVHGCSPFKVRSEVEVRRTSGFHETHSLVGKTRRRGCSARNLLICDHS